MKLDINQINIDLAKQFHTLDRRGTRIVRIPNLTGEVGVFCLKGTWLVCI